MSALILLLLACKKPVDDTSVADEPSPLLDVDETESWDLGLSEPAYVIRTDLGVPHLYAANLSDLGKVEGFTIARDRFFEMDLVRRLARGTLSELLGDIALTFDMESRGNGMATAARIHLEGMETDAELTAFADGFADGVNAYIDAVSSGDLPPPSELTLAGPFLGATDPTALMHPFSRADVAASMATFLYISGFETDDLSRTERAASLDSAFTGAALEDLRRAGLLEDLWDNPTPPNLIGSAEGWGLTEGGTDPAARRSHHPARFPRPAHVPSAMLHRLQSKQDAFELRFLRDHAAGFGSNGWVVAGTASATGNALLAGDGHLALTTPNYFYQIGLDTEHLGDGDLHVSGLAVPGLPQMATGTNGDVAYVSTQFGGDITDWYAEQVALDENGVPSQTFFQGEWKDLEVLSETYVIADVPLLGSVGRTETWDRYRTFDGRVLAEIEGTEVDSHHEPAQGESVVTMLGTFVVPGDIDGDGIISGITFAYTGVTEGMDGSQLFHRWNTAGDVREYRDAHRGAVATSLNWVAADSAGSIYYSGYQAIPCRDYLPRDEDNVWIDGADPRMLLDGTTYGGFRIPMQDGVVDESSDDPYECVVPFEQFPASIDPAKGYLLTANNDPGWITTDGSIYDDPWYVGGPWLEGFRATTIDNNLAAAVAADNADVAKMAEIQADHTSPWGAFLVPHLLAALDTARNTTPDEDWEERLEALYAEDADRYDDVYDRLSAWSDAGYPARSGVETFYHTPASEDAAHSVATTIHHAWLTRYLWLAVDDEGFPGLDPGGDTARARVIQMMWEGRGADNPLDLASWNPETLEPAYWDRLGTFEIEHAEEIALTALRDALVYLESEPVDGWQGGYGTSDMDQWLWGLRHMVKFESTVGDFLEDDTYSFLTDALSITTEVLPLADDITSDDPRGELPWFPRHGAQHGVDAGNPGFDDSWSYGSGPVFRMVIELDPNHPTGINILPGGQSGLTDSEHFADQAALWLGNETIPMYVTLEDVIAAAEGRESFF